MRKVRSNKCPNIHENYKNGDLLFIGMDIAGQHPYFHPSTDIPLRRGYRFVIYRS